MRRHHDDVLALSERRVALYQLPHGRDSACFEALVKFRDLLRNEHIPLTDDPEVLQAFVLDNVQKGLEGIVAKKLDSPYQAGARNFNWVKLKRVQAGQGPRCFSARETPAP